MSIVSSTFREAGQGQSSSSSEQGTRIQRAFKIACSAAANTTETVRAWAGCPVYGKGLPLDISNPDAITYNDDWICIQSQVDRLEGSEPGKFWFLITATYAPKPSGWDGSILSKVDKRGGGATVTEPVRFDASGNALVNSAAEAPDPLPEAPNGDLQFSLTVRKVSLSAYLNKSWKKNSDSWHGMAVGTVLIGEISWVRSDAGDTAHWEITIPMTYRAAGWDLKLIDAGYNELYVPSGGDALANLRRIHILDPDTGERTEPTSPVPLDGSGAVLASGQPLVINTHPIYGTATFGAGGMSLPDPFSL